MRARLYKAYWLVQRPKTDTTIYPYHDYFPIKRSELEALGYDDAIINYIEKNPHWMEFHIDDTFLGAM